MILTERPIFIIKLKPVSAVLRNQLNPSPNFASPKYVSQRLNIFTLCALASRHGPECGFKVPPGLKYLLVFAPPVKRWPERGWALPNRLGFFLHRYTPQQRNSPHCRRELAKKIQGVVFFSPCFCEPVGDVAALFLGFEPLAALPLDAVFSGAWFLPPWESLVF